jgi:hypothetical protein
MLGILVHLAWGFEVDVVNNGDNPQCSRLCVEYGDPSQTVVAERLPCLRARNS